MLYSWHMNIEDTAFEEKKSTVEGNSPLELEKFSKKYSRTGRQQIAEKIKELRFKQTKKKEGNPELFKNVEEKKAEVERLEKEKNLLVEEIKKLEVEVKKEKSKILSRIQSFFKKIQIEQELKIEESNKKIEEIKKGIEERLTIISETENVISDNSFVEEAKKSLDIFYKEQENLQTIFGKEEAKRSVENLSKENDCVFTHGIPWGELIGSGNVHENNSTANTGKMSPDDRIKLLMGLQPTISVSVLKEGTRKEGMYPFGVILGGGRVLSAYDDDAGTVAETLYYRKSKYDHDEKTKITSIQSDIEKNIAKSIASPTSTFHSYNEFIVEEPKIAGFYVNVSSGMFDDRDVFHELQKHIKQFDLPVFAIKDGKIYPFGTESTADFEDFTRDNGTGGTIVSNQKRTIIVGENSIPLEKIIEKRKNLDNEEKMALATSVMEKNPFQISNNFDSRTFNAYKNGGGVKFYTGNFIGKEGYRRFLENQKFNKFRVEKGISDTLITSSSILNEGRQHILDLKQKISSAESYKHQKMWKDDLRLDLFAIYGFAQGARENNDTEASKLAEDIINEFGSIEECKSFVGMRVDEQDKFKVLDIDIPIEVRQKIADLAKIE